MVEPPKRHAARLISTRPHEIRTGKHTGPCRAIRSSTDFGRCERNLAPRSGRGLLGYVMRSATLGSPMAQHQVFVGSSVETTLEDLPYSVPRARTRGLLATLHPHSGTFAQSHRRSHCNFREVARDWRDAQMGMIIAFLIVMVPEATFQEQECHSSWNHRDMLIRVLNTRVHEGFAISWLSAHA